MENHLRLLNRPTTKIVAPEERLGIAMADIINQHAGHAIAQGSATVLASIRADLVSTGPKKEEQIEKVAASIRDHTIKPSGLVEIKRVGNGSGAVTGKTA